MLNGIQTPASPTQEDVRDAVQAHGGDIVGLGDLVQTVAETLDWRKKTDRFYLALLGAILAAEEAGELVCVVRFPALPQDVPPEVRGTMREAIALLQPFAGGPATEGAKTHDRSPALLLGGEREVQVCPEIAAALEMSPLTAQAVREEEPPPSSEATIEAARDLFTRGREEADHVTQEELFLKAAVTELAAPGCNPRSFLWYAGSVAKARGARFFWAKEWDAAADWDLEFFTLVAADPGIESLFGPAVEGALKYYLQIAQRKAGVWADFDRDMTPADVTIMLASNEDPLLERHLTDLLRRLWRANQSLLDKLEEEVLAADDAHSASAVQCALRLIRDSAGS